MSINLERLKKAVDEMAPVYSHIKTLERAIREGEFLEGGIEKGLVRERHSRWIPCSAAVKLTASDRISTV